MIKQFKCFFTAIFLLALSCNVFAADPVLKWDASTGDVSGYTIYYGLSEGSYTLSQDVGNVTEYALSNLSLSEGTTYYFVVRAYNSAGESGDSNVATYTVPSTADTTPPVSPSDVSGTVEGESVLVQWQANSETDIAGYNVYYGTVSRDYSLPVSASGTEYPITGLETDVTYYIAVTAVDTSGNESGYSTEISAIIPGIVEGPVLRWDASTGEVSGYNVYYGTAEGQYTQSVDVGNVTQYALSNLSLTEGVTYYFIVRAYNSAGESGDSNVATYIVGESSDTAAPSISITSPTTSDSYISQSNSIDVSGSASDDVGVASVSWSNSRGGSGTATGTTSWSISSLYLAEGDNLISVTATDTTGNTSTDVLTVTYAVPDTTAPIVSITSPTAEGSYDTSSNTIEIGGSASDDSGIASVTWSNSSGGSGEAVGTTSWTISSIALADGENVITVTALDAVGNSSVSTLTVVYDEGPVLKWDASTGEVSGYNVYYGTAQGQYTESVDVGNVTQYALSNLSLTEGVNYYFIVRAYNAAGESDDSNVATYIIGESSDATAPSVSITSPTTSGSYSTQESSLEISGTASDDVGVASVAWSNSRGGSGTANGTTSWSVDGVVLAEGVNVISITAADTTGNTSSSTLTVTYTIPDTTAPVVSITSPTTDATYDTQTETLNISGSASDDTGVASVNWLNSRGGSGTATGTTSWSVSGVELAEGENIITVAASDESGNSFSTALTVVYTIPDTTPPVVNITLPTTDTAYNTQTGTLDMSGSASDDVGVTSVAWSNSRGGSGTAVGATNWSVSGIALAEGENVITVAASDEAGNSSASTLTIVYTVPDTTAPSVSISSPTTGTSYNTQSDTVDIGGSAIDDVGVASVTWSNSRGGSGTAVGTTSWSVSGIALAEGENIISVAALDEAGNGSTSTLTVVYTVPDTIAPSVSITSPTTGTSYDTQSDTVDMGGSAIDDTGVTSVTWSNSLGGSGTATGTTSWSISGIALSEGENVITVTALDAAGNSSASTLTVVYTVPDTTAPSVSITSPTTAGTYSTGSSILDIGGSAGDNVDVVSVTWSNAAGGSGVAVGTSSWGVSGITLAEGENIITVTALDEAGNSSVSTLAVEYTVPVTPPPVVDDTEAPVLTLTAPASGGFYYTRATNIKLTGTVSDNVAVKEVRWSIEQGGSGTADVDGSDWVDPSVPLNKWWNNIEVVAEDEAGNTSVVTLTVFCWRK